ncbi:MAG TPA: hypothetical protein VJ697_08075 [Nitrososphaeraceae archaeon]|nr:hypothetical protein [Nitrososphaeraceae archaeon]
MVDNWDLEEKTKNSKIYETHEGRLQAMRHIVKEYLKYKQIKIDPSKPLDDAIDLIENTICYDKEFHKFALKNYYIDVKFDEKNDMFYIGLK